jgi:hypothetical protein
MNTNLQTRFAALFASVLVTVAILGWVSALSTSGHVDARIVASMASSRA